MSAVATQPTPRVLPRAPVSPIRATIVLPAFNEQAGIAVALRELMTLVDETVEVLVINDGSADGTGAVARALGARVIDHDRNLGKAAAVRTAIRAARGERLVLMDADGTYPAPAALQIVRMLDRYDMVVGARRRGRANIPMLNRFGNGLFSLALRRISGLPLADPLTGLYGLHRRHLAAMSLEAEGFAVEAEIVVRAGHMGLRTANLPIAYRARAGQSKLHPLRDGLAIARTIVRVAMNVRAPRPAIRATAPRRRDG